MLETKVYPELNNVYWQEKRKYPRFRYYHSALLVGHTMQKVIINDVSADGIGLITQGAIFPREFVKIFILDDMTKGMLLLTGNVMHVEKKKCGVHLNKLDFKTSTIYQGLLMEAKLQEEKAREGEIS